MWNIGNVSRKSLDFAYHVLIFQIFLSVLKFVLSFKYTSLVVTEKYGGGIFLQISNFTQILNYTFVMKQGFTL